VISVALRLLLVLTLALGGCASAAPLATAARGDEAGPVLRFGVDTFDFPNESRAKNQGKPDLYANYCFVMARGVTQFLRFARFEPDLPRLDHAGYAERVRQVAARAPWDDPLPAAERVVIPGYASLRDLSAGEEAAVKEGLGTQLWTMIHWTNWRVIFPAPGWHQERVARQAIEELQAGRPVQLLVTNFPTPELNHSVLAYQYEVAADGDVDFLVYDPNDPYRPGIVRWDHAERRFVAARLFDTDPGAIRAFRMYYWPLL
jgi:hypothetical protein